MVTLLLFLGIYQSVQTLEIILCFCSRLLVKCSQFISQYYKSLWNAQFLSCDDTFHKSLPKQPLKRGSNLCLVKRFIIIAALIKTNLLSKQSTNTEGSALTKLSFVVSPAELDVLQPFQTVKEKFLSWVMPCRRYLLVFILIFIVLRGHWKQSNDGKRDHPC